MFIKLFLLCLIFKSICSDSIANKLKKRFNDVRSKCIDSHQHRRPAYECSGLMIRGVSNVGGAEQKFAWSKKEKNSQANAFSFAFLRKDQLFQRLPGHHESGFIIYPHFQTPNKKNKYSVLCAFPVDAHTDGREGHGCGKLREDTTGESGHCDTQNIKTKETWISRYETIMGSTDDNFVIRQCAFDTSSEDAAKNFAVALEANEYLREHSPKYRWRNNEIRTRGWNHNHPKKLPLEAFFYIIGSGLGHQEVKTYQCDYFHLTGETIPIVGIGLPQQDNPHLVIE